MDLQAPRIVHGELIAPNGAKFGVVAARFNSFIVDRLIEGAVDALSRHGVANENINVIRVPGAFELPLIAKRLAQSGKVDAVIVLGAVIRGATPHFDYVAGEAARGLMNAMLETGRTIVFGVLTTDTIEQAIERAGTKAGNKGFDAACVALEMVNLERAMKSPGA